MSNIATKKATELKPVSAAFQTKLEGCLGKVFPQRRAVSPTPRPAIPSSHPSAPVVSAVSITSLSITMSTSTATQNGAENIPQPSNTTKDISTSTTSLRRTSAASVTGESTSEGTTQVFPTKYIKNVDSLVQAMQAIVGEKGTFKIEMRHASYIVESPVKIEIRDLLERIASQQELKSPADDNEGGAGRQSVAPELGISV